MNNPLADHQPPAQRAGLGACLVGLAVASLAGCTTPPVTTESAWGEGTGFPGKDWSMYFSTTPTETTVTGSGVWLATDYEYVTGTFGPDVAPNACWPTAG